MAAAKTRMVRFSIVASLPNQIPDCGAFYHGGFNFKDVVGGAAFEVDLNFQAGVPQPFTFL